MKKIINLGVKYPFRTLLALLFALGVTVEAIHQIKISAVINTLNIVKNMNDNNEIKDGGISPWGTSWTVDHKGITTLNTPENICSNAEKAGAFCTHGKFSFSEKS